MNWSAAFTGLPPIDLPDGRKLETLAALRAVSFWRFPNAEVPHRLQEEAAN